MRIEQVRAKVKLTYGGEGAEVEALFDTGASVSVASEDLARKLASFRELPPEDRYFLGTAKKDVMIHITAKVDARVEVAGYEMPITTFDVSLDLPEGALIIGRPELDKWDIVFTPEGPRPRRYPIRLELI